MDVFGMFGFMFGLMAFSVASQAMRELTLLRKVLREEVDALRLEVRGKPPGQAESIAGADGGEGWIGRDHTATAAAEREASTKDTSHA